MASNRRDFLKTSTLGAALLGLAGQRAAAGAGAARGGSGKGLNLLILGGTSYIGPHIIERALERGHSMTLFNRGRTNTHLFPELEKLRGDRDPDKGEGLKALEGRAFDAVIDTSGHFPRHVKASAELLGQHARQYLFISSLSALGDHSKPGMDESAPVATMPDATVETFGEGFENFGPLKALCEQAAEEAMPGRATSLRPGLIVGPGDTLPRFTYWPVRVQRGGEVLAPGHHDDPVQYIDVRDLANFVIHCLEQQTTGLFNTNGPTSPTNIAEVLYGCKAVTGGDVTFTWADAEFLQAEGLQPWAQMPLWIPPVGEYAGFHLVDCSKAIAAGYTSRPLAETVADTLEWYNAWPEDKPFPWRGGIPAEKEAEILAKWHARAKKAEAPAETQGAED